MEWLWGAFAGGVIGLGSALIVTEYMSYRGRQRMKRDFAKSLDTEISLNRDALQRLVDGISDEVDKGQRIRHIHPPFVRDVYPGSAGDMGLLPSSTRDAVQNFYAWLGDVEFVVREGYLQRTLFWPSDKLDTHEQHEVLQEWMLERARGALERSVVALEKLETFTA